MDQNQELGSDRAGFTQYVTLRHSQLLRTAYLLCGGHHLAEDLVQQALLSAARHWRRIHASPDAYVRRSLVNANISRWRRHRDREVVLADVTTSAPEGGADHDDSDTRLSLGAALASLTAKQRAVLVLRYYEDLTEPQTAEILGIGLGTVKSTARQALTRLRERAPHLAELIGEHR